MASGQTGQLGHTAQTGQTSHKEQTGQADLTFKLDFSRNLCRAAFAIIAMFSSHHTCIGFRISMTTCDRRMVDHTWTTLKIASSLHINFYNIWHCRAPSCFWLIITLSDGGKFCCSDGKTWVPLNKVSKFFAATILVKVCDGVANCPMTEVSVAEDEEGCEGFHYFSDKTW